MKLYKITMPVEKDLENYLEDRFVVTDNIFQHLHINQHRYNKMTALVEIMGNVIVCELDKRNGRSKE